MRSITKTLLAATALCGGLVATAAGAQTLRVAHVDPDDWTGSKKGAAAQIFQIRASALSE